VSARHNNKCAWDDVDDIDALRSREYPHIFNNHEPLKFADCRSKTLIPLIEGGVYRPGRDEPVPDRVVYTMSKEEVCEVCAAPLLFIIT
jgi:hypothetical protein